MHAPHSMGRLALFIFGLSVSLLALFTPTAAGQLSFYQAPTYTGTAVVTGDFNQDGKLDLINSAGTVLLGKGDGTFTTGVTLSNAPSFVADFNDDGKPDVLAFTSANHLLVYLGNGDGTFQAPQDTYAAVLLYGLAVADVNGDQKPDVLVPNPNGGVLVFLGKGDGTFAAPVNYSSPVAGQLFCGDFNGDGKPDVLASAYGSVSVLLGNGDGTFQAPKTTTSSALGSIKVIGDLNGDHKLDLVVTTSSNTPQLGTMFGNGDGTFQAPSNVFTTNLSTNPTLADINGDGKLDLLVQGFPFVQVYLGNGDGTFTVGHGYSYNSINLATSTILLGDFNDDQKLDIAAAQSILLGNGDGTFKASPAILLPNGDSISDGTGTGAVAVSGDFNGDGKSDIAVASSGGNIYIYLADAAGSFSLAHTYAVSVEGAGGLSTGDFNGDGKLDLIATVNSGGTSVLTVLLGNGDGSFGAPIVSNSCPAVGLGIGAIADLNGDHKSDLALPNAMPNGESLSICLNNGDGTFASPVNYFFGANVNSVVVADFNNDGKLDAAFGGDAGAAIFIGNGDGTFQGANYLLTTRSVVGEAVDFNRDGNVDLIINGTVYLGNGQGNFQPLSQTSGLGGTIVDLNGDGYLDLIDDNFYVPMQDTPELVTFLGNGDGTFQTPIVLDSWDKYTLASTFTLTGDFNGDGRPDLAIDWGIVGNAVGIQILLNTTPPTAGANFSPRALTFPSQAAGTNSNPVSVTLSNSGKAALNVSAVAISGTSAGEFTQTNNCTTVQSGASCVINVMFSPTSAGNAMASLNVTDNAIGSPQTIVLSGSATGLGLTASSNNATVSAGSPATYNLSIGGAGWSGQAALTCTGAPKGAACSVAPGNVAVSATSTSSLVVTVTTTSRTSAALVPMQFRSSPWLWAVALVGFVILPTSARRQSSKRQRSTSKFTRTLPLLLILLLSACGGGGGSSSNPQPNPNGTPAGTYTVTVMATPTGGTAQSLPLTLTVQ